MKTRADYNYKQLSIIFDLNVDEDREMFEWLEQNKSKRNGYGAQLRKALKRLMQEEKQEKNV
jgi:hypothetical protein